MTNQELYTEIKELRKDFHTFKDEHNKSFYLFKGKAFGFLALLTVVVNLGFNFIFKK